ncbi:hypothetical protein C0991_010494, partial [Blastosporella zonata]
HRGRSTAFNRGLGEVANLAVEVGASESEEAIFESASDEAGAGARGMWKEAGQVVGDEVKTA